MIIKDCSCPNDRRTTLRESDGLIWPTYIKIWTTRTIVRICTRVRERANLDILLTSPLNIAPAYSAKSSTRSFHHLLPSGFVGTDPQTLQESEAGWHSTLMLHTNTEFKWKKRSTLIIDSREERIEAFCPSPRRLLRAASQPNQKEKPKRRSPPVAPWPCCSWSSSSSHHEETGKGQMMGSFKHLFPLHDLGGEYYCWWCCFRKYLPLSGPLLPSRRARLAPSMSVRPLRRA